MFNEDWDEEEGLWWGGGPPHTAALRHLHRVHPGPGAACRLLAAAQLGRLGEIDVKRVLEKLSSMVWTSEENTYGLIKWYLEEKEPGDSNAAFFTGLPLAALRSAHAEKLDAGELSCLDWILKKLSAWFLRCLRRRGESYPNKYLGDLVCAWLIIEQLNIAGAGIVAAAMRRAAGYWGGKGGWGWGEHLGSYIRILLDELSVLLVLEKTLPSDIRADYLELLNELLHVQDLFRGGPQVPALRCYAFTEPPGTDDYRANVRRWKHDERIEFTNRLPLADLLAERGWHEMVAPPAAASKLPATFSLPCFGGKKAFAHVEENIRLGGMSRFPVMDWAERAGWGLSWQCFPVALWRPGGDWGFLIWRAEECGARRYHPWGESLGTKRENIGIVPRQLTGAVSPPFVGRTESRMRPGDLLAARFMPFRSSAWQDFGDGFRIISTRSAAEVERSEGIWTRAVFSWDDRRVSVEFLNLTDDRVPVLLENGFGGYDLTVNYDTAGEGPALGLWRIRLDGGGDGPPIVEEHEAPAQPRPPGGGTFKVAWGSRLISIDPLGADLMHEEDAGSA